MALFLDSATLAEAQRAQALGFIEGITTNPGLMQDTGRPALEVLAELVEVFDGHIFYQLKAESLEARIDEAWEAYNTRPDRVVIILMATTENLSLIPRLPGVDIAITGVFSMAQAYVAAQAGAHYVMPYVDVAINNAEYGTTLVQDIAQVLQNTETELLAADLTSVGQALRALNAGAHHLTLPLALIEDMGEHPLTGIARGIFPKQ